MNNHVKQPGAERFGSDVESFYDETARQRGYIEGPDRMGRKCRFPLLGISGAVLHLPAGRPVHAIDGVSQEIALLKKAAKSSPERMQAATLSGPPTEQAI